MSEGITLRWLFVKRNVYVLWRARETRRRLYVTRSATANFLTDDGIINVEFEQKFYFCSVAATGGATGTFTT